MLARWTPSVSAHASFDPSGLKVGLTDWNLAALDGSSVIVHFCVTFVDVGASGRVDADVGGRVRQPSISGSSS